MTEKFYNEETFRDLGFVAKENGKFDVYAAGGLGIKPKFGVMRDRRFRIFQSALCGKNYGRCTPEQGIYVVNLSAKDAFAIYENGSQKQGEEAFGEELGVLAVEDIPEFFVGLGRAVQKEGITYIQFIKKYPEKIKEMAQSFL